MDNPDLIVYKGSKSQTGIAFAKEFPKVEFLENEKSFEEIKNDMQFPQKAILPIWNSHEGEISLSNAFSMIFDSEALLYFLWPKEIEFCCYARGAPNFGVSKLISVKVAETQCSSFIEKHGYVFEPVASTNEAFKKFCDSKSFSAVLVPPGADKNNEFDVQSSNAANPVNFTTFSLLGSPDSGGWASSEWGGLFDMVDPKKSFFVAIDIPYSDELTDNQNELFDKLVENANSVEDIPRAIFVAKHDNDRCRVLIEASDEFAPSEILDEDGADDSIRIVPRAGFSSCDYSKRVNSFLKDKFVSIGNDFFRHTGSNSCFFSCPAFGVITHGFDVNVTKEIFLRMINKCFELMERIGASDEKSDAGLLYIKYRDKHLEFGVSFIDFYDL